MSVVRRVVFDTSTLVSVVLRPVSRPRDAFLEALARCELFASLPTLDELGTVLRRTKFDTYTPLQKREEFLVLYRQQTTLSHVGADHDHLAQGACRDARDDKFLALSLAAKADVIVSSDADLLTLGTWHDTRILAPVDFLARFAGSSDGP